MIVGIYDWADRFIDENTSNNGGSQTWVIEISKALSNMGIETHVFCNCKFHKNKNITFIPKTKYEEVVRIVEYDKFIFARGFKKIDLIHSKEIDVLLHDECLFEYSKHDFDKVKNIFLLSEHSMEKFTALYGPNYKDKYKLTFNGIDQSIFKNYKKENMMIWSSCQERGYEFFIKKVYPLIKKEVPDFKVNVCQYNNDRPIFIPAGVSNLGRLDKNTLADYQSKAKLWCYPNLGYHDSGRFRGMEFNETFCITAVENAFAGANIVCGCNGGLTTTLEKEKLIGKEFFKNKKCINENEYAKLLADTCIKILKNEIEIKCDVSKYTWENAAKSLLC